MDYTLPLKTDEDTAVQSISLHALGQNWTIYRPASLEDLWEQMTAPPPTSSYTNNFVQDISDCNYNKHNQHNLARALTQAFEEDDRIPYWTEIWPAGIALAEWLGEQRNKIRNRVCLDLGCGLGFTALAGAYLGAKVLAMHYEYQALYYAALNGRALKKEQAHSNCKQSGAQAPASCNPVCNPNCNPVCQAPIWLAADWRHPCFKPGSVELIWAGDIMYEHRFINPVASFLEHTLAKNGVVWIAEPGRNIYPEFAKTMQNRGWQVYIAGRRQARLPESRAPLVNVQIWQLQRKPL